MHACIRSTTIAWGRRRAAGWLLVNAQWTCPWPCSGIETETVNPAELVRRPPALLRPILSALKGPMGSTCGAAATQWTGRRRRPPPGWRAPASWPAAARARSSRCAPASRAGRAGRWPGAPGRRWQLRPQRWVEGGRAMRKPGAWQGRRAGGRRRARCGLQRARARVRGRSAPLGVDILQGVQAVGPLTRHAGAGGPPGSELQGVQQPQHLRRCRLKELPPVSPRQRGRQAALQRDVHGLRAGAGRRQLHGG